MNNAESEFANRLKELRAKGSMTEMIEFTFCSGDYDLERTKRKWGNYLLRGAISRIVEENYPKPHIVEFIVKLDRTFKDGRFLNTAAMGVMLTGGSAEDILS